jgi:hypothetical protein
MTKKEQFIAGQVFTVYEGAKLMYKCKYGDTDVAYVVEGLLPEDPNEEIRWAFHCSVELRTNWFDASASLFGGKSTAQATLYFDHLFFINKEGGQDV